MSIPAIYDSSLDVAQADNGYLQTDRSAGRPPINPPRAPVQDGVMVVFGPLDPSDDPDAPPNQIFTHKCVLPLTPSSIQLSDAGNWTDGVYAVRGDERGRFEGSQLANLTFSGRLEPPAYYISASRVSKISDVESGQVSDATLDAVRGPDGQLMVVEAGQVGGPVDVNAEILVEQAGFGQIYGGAPPSLPGGTDVVMSDGAISPPGFWWHEPHDLASMFRGACRTGEKIRIIVGDQYGLNMMASIRTFNWRVEDSDPDVINFDMTLREHRANPEPTGPASQAKKKPPRSYTTKDGDTLHRIASLQLGDPSLARRILQYNLKTFEGMWRYPWPPATSPAYYPANESVGARITAERGGVKVGTIKQWPAPAFGPDTYIRKDVRLTLVAPSKKKTSPKRTTHGT